MKLARLQQDKYSVATQDNQVGKGCTDPGASLFYLWIRNVRSGRYVAELEEFVGYRHVVTTADPAKALRVDEETAARICDRDVLGEPFRSGGYNGRTRTPDYERVMDLWS